MNQQQYDDTNRGALFKNDKQGNENRPDYKGQINVNGVDMWLSSWIKTSKTGAKYMSLSVQPKDAQQPAQQGYQQQAPQQQAQQQPAGQPVQNEPMNNLDSDIPF